MTQKEMDNLTKEQLHEFGVRDIKYQPNLTLEEYTERVRDSIYMWRHIIEGRKGYTFEEVTESVSTGGAPSIIKQYYNQKASVDDAAVDVDYCCG